MAFQELLAEGWGVFLRCEECQAQEAERNCDCGEAAGYCAISCVSVDDREIDQRARHGRDNHAVSRKRGSHFAMAYHCGCGG